MPNIRNGTVPPEHWRGGENGWTREKLRTYQDWMRNPKGADPNQDAGKRSKPESYGRSESSDDELIELMIKRGVLAP